jgi:hypothetical protein
MARLSHACTYMEVQYINVAAYLSCPLCQRSSPFETILLSCTVPRDADNLFSTLALT